MRWQKIFIFLFLFPLFLSLAGCEAFVRKFTRKSKKSDQAVEMVLAPEEYKGPNMTKEELYRQYYVFWQSWQEELNNALIQKSSLKKKVDCAEQALKNLVNMRGLLVESARKNMDGDIAKSRDLRDQIEGDIYGTNNSRNLEAAEHLKSHIQKNFIYPKVKDYLK